MIDWVKFDPAPSSEGQNDLENIYKIILVMLLVTLNAKFNSVIMFQTNLFTALPSECNGNLPL